MKEQRKRDSPREVKIRIIKSLIECLNNNLSIALLAKKTKSHSQTISRLKRKSKNPAGQMAVGKRNHYHD